MSLRTFSVRLRFISLPTQDVERARAFYQGLLGLPSSLERGETFVQLWGGGVDLCLEGNHMSDGPMLIFTVDRLNSLLAALADAAVAVEGPLIGRERRYIVLRDPDSHALVFEEETSPVS
jgi:catechol 2,3-dioxygenase-like lactoylglutathione lyase family enzyme